MKEKWSKIPSIQLPSEISDSTIDTIMASYHIAGKTTWRPFAKAQHIYRLHTHHEIPLEKIAIEVGMEENEVQQNIDAYEYLQNEVVQHAEEGMAVKILESKFSHALELFKGKKLAEIRENENLREDMAKLIANDEITGMEVRNAHKAIKKSGNTEKLKQDGIKNTMKKVKEEDPVKYSKALTSMKSLTEKIKKMSSDEAASIRGNFESQLVVSKLTPLFEFIN